MVAHTQNGHGSLYLPENFLGRPKTADYAPSAHESTWVMGHKQPIFTLQQVKAMLADSRVTFGLYLLKGPILSKAKVFIKTGNADLKRFMVDNITRFWRNSCNRALKSIEWGYSCSEVLYQLRQDQIHFAGIKDLHSLDCRPLKNDDGQVKGATVRHVRYSQPSNAPINNATRILGPRCFWHVHGREHHPRFGRSRLFGAYAPWLEIWSDGGFRDTRQLFHHKYAFSGGGIYYPPGMTKINLLDGSGIAQTISNKDLGREIVEKMKAGGTVQLPNITDDKGQRLWEMIAPTANPPPPTLFEYGKDLKDEIWEGMGIPPEVARAEGTGAYAGRFIPQQAFYAILQEIFFWLLSDADEQIFKPLARVNFGDDVADDYELHPFSLLDSEKPDYNQGEADQNQIQQGPQGGNEQGSQMGIQLALDVERSSLDDDEPCVLDPFTGKLYRIRRAA